MNYKLAKELKDAGFPQEYLCQHWEGTCCEHDRYIHADGKRNDEPYTPTLSELIEACGDENGTGFHSLKQEMDFARRVDNEKPPSSWIAEDWKKHVFIGNTPEEAVARLWLVLNKK